MIVPWLVLSFKLVLFKYHDEWWPTVVIIIITIINIIIIITTIIIIIIIITTTTTIHITINNINNININDIIIIAPSVSPKSFQSHFLVLTVAIGKTRPLRAASTGMRWRKDGATWASHRKALWFHKSWPQVFQWKKPWFSFSDLVWYLSWAKEVISLLFHGFSSFLVWAPTSKPSPMKP